MVVGVSRSFALAAGVSVACMDRESPGTSQRGGPAGGGQEGPGVAKTEIKLGRIGFSFPSQELH
jgi:hypothetical protein